MSVLGLIIAVILIAVEIPVFVRDRQEEDLYIIVGAALMLIILLAYLGR